MRRYCKLIVILIVLLAACSDQTPNRLVECEGSIAPCTFEEVIPRILRSHPSTPSDVAPFTIDFIKKRYGVEKTDCSHPLLSDNSEFVRIAELSPGPDTKIWYSREELKEYDTETAWECDNGENFTEYVKGTPRSTSKSLVIDQTSQYGIVEGTVADPEILKRLEILWENCKTGTQPPNFTGIFTSGIGFLPPEDQRFCVTLDILPGGKQCFAKTAPLEFIEYSSHNGQISRKPVSVSEPDYCRLEGNTDSQARRVKIF